MDAHEKDRTPARVLIAVVVVAVLAVVLFAAAHSTGSSGGSAASGQDATANAAAGAGDQPDLGGFAAAALGDVPTPGGAEPLGDPTQQGHFVSQAFLVEGLTPAQVMSFYEDNLSSDWQPDGSPTAIGACRDGTDPDDFGCSYRGAWVSGGDTLEVTAVPDNGDADNLGNGTDLNIVLIGSLSNIGS